ncbi:MAG: S53 family peptidase, partial [Actinomycetota bacterium]|nr:S53 family peptidase [Actinomycetota bacterium]
MSQPLSREEFQTAHAARPDDVQAVQEFAAQHGLAVGEIHPERRSIQLTGSLAALGQAFGATLLLYHHPADGEYRGYQGPLTVPSPLGQVITGVFGLEDRVVARAQFRPAASPSTQFTPPQLAQAYNFPAGYTGAGQCVAILEFGGGFRPEDIAAYFQQIGVSQPTVVAVSVDGAANSPSTSSGPDGEVMLDIEVIGGLAPGALIAVYFAPNSEQGFIDAISTAAHDTVRKPSVISISWGGPENNWSAQARQQIEQGFTDAGAMGVTVTAASGDNGSSDGVNDGSQHTDFPSSAPHALACGGTDLQVSGGKISGQSVWNSGAGGGATGGGISDVFPVPAYQQGISLPPSVNDGQTRRGVPDVAGDADPATGYTVRVDGQTLTIGGTSAVAPLWAALIAVLNQALGKSLGFFHPTLYTQAVSSTLNDVTQGSNGAYSAGPGWDACTGLGSPDGAKLLAALQGSGPMPPPPRQPPPVAPPA